MPNNSPEDRAAFITQAKTLIKSIENPELRNQYLKLVSERYSTTRSLAGIKVAHPKREKAPAAEQPAAPQVSVPWELLSPIEVRFANLLFRNPTLLDRAAEYFDMDFAASGIQIFDSPLIDEFIQSILAQYAETGAFSPRTLYESLSPQLQLFLEQLPDETWKTPNEILEFYDTLAVLTLNLCDRYKKLIPLDSEAGMRLRMQLNKFTQGIQTISKKRKISAITPDVFAEQIIQSKTPLIELYTEINELAMNGGNAAQFNNAPTFAPSAIPQATTAAQPSSPQYAAPAVQSAFQQPEMPPEMEAPPPFESDEQFASSEPPEDVPYDPNEDEPYVPDDDFGAMDDFG
jgi:DNA primase